VVNIPLKIIGKEFQKNCYETIFRKINTEEIFSNLHSLQIKTIFQEKNSISEKLLSRYMWCISMVVTSLIGANCECLQILLVNIAYLLVKISNTRVLYRNGLLCCIRL